MVHKAVICWMKYMLRRQKALRGKKNKASALTGAYLSEEDKQLTNKLSVNGKFYGKK